MPEVRGQVRDLSLAYEIADLKKQGLRQAAKDHGWKDATRG
ncbi:MAG: hypothetical protein ABSA41_08215 [Terriglobia bacterium]|jgi:predicted heme/steroid binding protein